MAHDGKNFVTGRPIRFRTEVAQSTDLCGMELHFGGRTNLNLPSMMISHAEFFVPAMGKTVSVYRDRTDCIVDDDGTYGMVWKDCHSWDGMIADYSYILPKDALFQCLKFEHRAQKDAFISVDTLYVSLPSEERSCV